MQDCKDLPDYVNFDLTSSFPTTFPVYMRDVTFRVFPLRSDISVQQNLIDQYVNFVPPEVGRFRAVLPYVYLTCINYGALLEERGRLGWSAYQEILFSIPATWFQLEEGQWAYRGLVWLAPYIFVDDPVVLTMGRHVYGWPKLQLHNDGAGTTWMHDPNGAIPRGRYGTPVFPELYAGRTQATRLFCDIAQHSYRSALGDYLPWSILANEADNSLNAGRAYLATLGALASVPSNHYTRPDVFS